MLEALVVTVLVLVGGVLLLLALLAVPLMLVGLVLRVLVALVVLPFRAAAWLLSAFGAVAVGLLKLVVGAFAVCLMVVLVVGALVLLPLLPVVLLIAAGWLGARMFGSPRPAPSP